MFDLQIHLKRQMVFSRCTFGPGARRAGVCDHIRKELVEVEACSEERVAAEEWVDVVILALDGLTRALRESGLNVDCAAGIACSMIEYKQGKNEDRNWPDWRTAPADRAIEHDRAEGAAT